VGSHPEMPVASGASLSLTVSASSTVVKCGMIKPKELDELRTDAWSRFERAVDVVAKSPPQHRIKNRDAEAQKNKG
jgi:hypothetical protein